MPASYEDVHDYEEHWTELQTIVSYNDAARAAIERVAADYALRPLSAALGVTPVEGGKHDTTATRWSEDKETQKFRDGVVEPDTVSITHTDT